MVSASKLIAVLSFWALIGITWAILNEQIIAKIPTMFPEPIAQDNENWVIMNFIWTVSIIGLALGSGISILGEKGLKGVIVSGLLIFAGMFTLIFLWASFWNVTNVTIPRAFSLGFGQVSNEKANLGIYDAAFEVMMIGLMIMSLMLGGAVSIGTGRRSSYQGKYRTIQQRKGAIRQRPQQETKEKTLYYEPSYKVREKTQVLVKQPDGTYKQQVKLRYHH